MRPYVRRQLAKPTVGGADGAPRCHVELNENKPYEFVGEDIILPHKE